MSAIQLRFKIKEITHKMLINYKRHFVKKQWRNVVKKYATGYKLNDGEKRQVDEIFRPYMKVSYEFHEYYSGNTGVFSPLYIPDDLYYNYIDRYYNDWEKATLFDNKCLYSDYFKGVYMPETLLLKMNGILFDSYHRIVSKEEALNIVSKENEIFIKAATESDGGRGVFCLSGSEIREKSMSIISSIPSDVIVQMPIHQHDRMAKINDSSVNSIRIISLLTESEVKIYSTIVRMGMSGSRVDNVSSGAISCGVDAHGKLRKYAYGSYGGRVEKHPTSGLVFEGYKIPGYLKVLEAVKKLHCQMPYFRLISWDFSVDKDEQPVLIEANFKYGALDFHQFGNGPLFGKDTHKILEEVFGKSNHRIKKVNGKCERKIIKR